MAKGKHSTALFEVIHAAQRPMGRSRMPAPRASASSLLRTPKWWFKNRTANGAGAAGDEPAADPNDPTANVTAATLTSPRGRFCSGAPAAEPADPDDGPFLDPHGEESAARVAPAPAIAAKAAKSAKAVTPAAPVSPPAPRDLSDPEPVLVAHAGDVPVPAPLSEAGPVAPAPAAAPAVAPKPAPRRTAAAQAVAGKPAPASRAGVHWAVDRGTREITLRLRYTAAAVGGFVLLSAVGLAYVVGKHAGQAPPQVSALAPVVTQTPGTPSARDVKKGPVQQNALDPLRGGARQASAKLDGSTAGVSQPADSPAFVDAPIDPTGVAHRDGTRNYILVQSYPPEMRENALKACNYLIQNHVPCTIESHSGWFWVVGTRGFPRRFMDSKEYQAYKKEILALGEKLVAKTGAKNPFDPTPLKWEGKGG